MSIEQDWKQLDGQENDELSSMLTLSKISYLHSHNPLQKLKTNLLINIIWGVLNCTGYFIIIITFPILQVQIGFAIIIIFSGWTLCKALLQYKSIQPNISANIALLDELKRQHQSFTEMIRTQLKVALFIYPISAAAGFMLGGVVGSGKSVQAFMQKPVIWIILLAIVVILTPLCHLLAKWILRYSFGKHLDTLQEKITELEAEK